MTPLRYGIVGGGFITAFQLKALRQVRGVEVAGLVSRRPPEQLAGYVREHRLGEGRIFSSVKEMVPHVDVVALFGPNFTRLEEYAIGSRQGPSTGRIMAVRLNRLEMGGHPPCVTTSSSQPSKGSKPCRCHSRGCPKPCWRL